MKGIIRLTALALMFGGWTLAAGALHLVRAPGRIILIPKDRLSFADTYVDTRNWTIKDVRQHPAVCARLVHVGRAEVLAQAVGNSRGNVEAQLADAIAHPEPLGPTTTPAMVERVQAEVHAATQSVKSIFD